MELVSATSKRDTVDDTNVTCRDVHDRLGTLYRISSTFEQSQTKQHARALNKAARELKAITDLFVTRTAAINKNTL